MKVLKKYVFGFFRGVGKCIIENVAAVKCFGGGVSGNAPAIAVTFVVIEVFKVGNNNVTAHLQAGNGSFKTFTAARLGW